MTVQIRCRDHVWQSRFEKEEGPRRKTSIFFGKAEKTSSGFCTSLRRGGVSEVVRQKKGEIGGR